jgi:hypothetical protein
MAISGQAITRQALIIGQTTLDFFVSFFLTLYLLYFLLRDGPMISKIIVDAIPLQRRHKQLLFAKLVTVVRATVKGNILVALIQDALGGLALAVVGVPGALLWGAAMVVLSLLPAIGAAIIWAPIALWFLMTEALWQGFGLILWGVLAIGLVDNLLRPLLVGKDTKLPDYLVLISTLGGMATFGLNGFVIGPIIAALFVAAWDIFNRAREEESGPDSPCTPNSGSSVTDSSANLLKLWLPLRCTASTLADAGTAVINPPGRPGPAAQRCCAPAARRAPRPSPAAPARFRWRGSESGRSQPVRLRCARSRQPAACSSSSPGRFVAAR